MFNSTGAKVVSFDTGHKSRKLQKSQSFGFNMSSSAVQSTAVGGSVNVRQSGDSERQARSRSSSCEHDSKMNQNKVRNIDPLASLPTSHTKQYHKNFGDSPSPTQSEYDTCDPWDDY